MYNKYLRPIKARDTVELSAIPRLSEPVILDPNGHWLAASKLGETDFAAFDVETGQEITTIRGMEGWERHKAELLDDGRIAIVWQRRNREPGRKFAVWDPSGVRKTLEWEDCRSLGMFEFLPKTWGGTRLVCIGGSDRNVFHLREPIVSTNLSASSWIMPFEKGLAEVLSVTLGDPEPIRWRFVGIEDCRVISEHSASVMPIINFDKLMIGSNGVFLLEPLNQPNSWLMTIKSLFRRNPSLLTIDLCTGHTVQHVPERTDNKSGMLVMAVGQYLWHGRMGIEGIEIHQWPLIAPGPPWWLWLTTALGVLLIARDIRQTRRRSAGSVVVSSTM